LREQTLTGTVPVLYACWSRPLWARLLTGGGNCRVSRLWRRLSGPGACLSDTSQPQTQRRTLSASAVNLESLAGFQPPRMLVPFVNITEVTKHSLAPSEYHY